MKNNDTMDQMGLQGEGLDAKDVEAREILLSKKDEQWGEEAGAGEPVRDYHEQSSAASADLRDWRRSDAGQACI